MKSLRVTTTTHAVQAVVHVFTIPFAAEEISPWLKQLATATVYTMSLCSHEVIRQPKLTLGSILLAHQAHQAH